MCFVPPADSITPDVYLSHGRMEKQLGPSPALSCSVHVSWLRLELHSKRRTLILNLQMLSSSALKVQMPSIFVTGDTRPSPIADCRNLENRIQKANHVVVGNLSFGHVKAACHFPCLHRATLPEDENEVSSSTGMSSSTSLRSNSGELQWLQFVAGMSSIGKQEASDSKI